MAFYTYLLTCADGTLYAGWTNDLEKRLGVHNQGKGAKYTRARLPVALAAMWEFPSQSEAMAWEFALKKLSRKRKLALIAAQ
jgi:putative endonuclease